jgi:hypothetical protein
MPDCSFADAERGSEIGLRHPPMLADGSEPLADAGLDAHNQTAIQEARPEPLGSAFPSTLTTTLLLVLVGAILGATGRGLARPMAERLGTKRESGEPQRDRQCKPYRVGKNPVWPTHLLGRRLRYQRVEAFCFSAPPVSALAQLFSSTRSTFNSMSSSFISRRITGTGSGAFQGGGSGNG